MDNDMNEVVFQILKILMEMQDYDGCVLGFYSKKPKEEKI